jgi:acyl-coenzyme A thioesterase PaaI-like protein
MSTTLALVQGTVRACPQKGLPKASLNVTIQAAERDLKLAGEDIMEKQPNSRMCFVCGIDNPIGLHLRFYTDDEGRCVARFRPRPEHQGYPSHLHGGWV